MRRRPTLFLFRYGFNTENAPVMMNWMPTVAHGVRHH
jgi:hypothetical protein